jgi:hypothetical protein
VMTGRFGNDRLYDSSAVYICTLNDINMLMERGGGITILSFIFVLAEMCDDSVPRHSAEGASL